MARVGIIGSSYQSQSPIADCQRTMNWYQENVESQMGAAQATLYPTPGLTLIATGSGPVRGEIEINGRMFWVGGGNLYEATSPVYVFGVLTSFTATLLGSVGNDLQPVTMATNGTLGNQLLICSASSLYLFTLDITGSTPANTLTQIGSLQGIPSMIVFCSSYFIALLANTNKFQVSNLLDGSAWNALGVQQNEEFPENISSIISSFGFLFVLGNAGHSQVYYDSGANQYTPFSIMSGAYMEEGCGAPNSPVVMDNTVFWLGGRNGKADIAWRANGYTPLRISNFGFETAVASYPSKGSDAIGYTYRDQGHTFWVLRFPSANGGIGATWVYDAATQQWHERGYWSQQGPTGYSAHLSTCYAFAFGQHLVGDWNSGNIYSMSINTLYDNGKTIRRWRRSPHISSERERIFLTRLQIDVEVGLGPQPPLLDGAGNPRDPQLTLRISRDGSKTFGVEYALNCGQSGDYLTRVILRRLGNARDFVFDIVATDPIPWRLIEGYVEGTGFPQPTQRMQKQIAQAQ
jgi:hypothetical protein